MRRLRSDVAVFAVVLSSFGWACDQAPGTSAEWTPADHDKKEQSATQQGVQQGRANAAQLVEIAWMQNCAVCHGPRGLGDGPNGPMTKTPDLTRGDWQTKVNDEAIEEGIRKGKGLMPPSDLPKSTLKGLVARIRALRATEDSPQADDSPKDP